MHPNILTEEQTKLLPLIGKFASDFYLVGGTALALYYGHRLSVDLDLFSKTDFDTEAVIAAIGNAFPEFRYSRPGSVGLFGFIGDLKTDFVRHHH